VKYQVLLPVNNCSEIKGNNTQVIKRKSLSGYEIFMEKINRMQDIQKRFQDIEMK